MEKTIQKIFDQAKRWSAVILLNEADALFGKGGPSNLAGNRSEISKGEHIVS